MSTRLILRLACVVAVFPITARAQAPTAFEQGVALKASELLPADSLRGPSFRVRDQVVTDGFMATFEIDTDFGTFTAAGVTQAKNG
jgi:hypothetical protein